MAERDPALARRVLSALALVPLALALAVVGGWGFAGLVEVAVFLMALEWGRLSSARYGPQIGRLAGPAVGIVGLASTSLIALDHNSAALWVLALGALAAAGIARLQRGPALWIGLGVGYVGLPALALIYLRSDPALGLGALVWLLVVVWSTDTAAYFVGRALGGPRLAPAISPGKTWSGFFGGVAGAALVSVFVAWIIDSQRLLQAATLGAVIAIVAQIGDLVESALKRRAGVKDAGRLIPGHGGVLDRLDGLLFAAPALALFVLLLGPKGWPWP